MDKARNAQAAMVAFITRENIRLFERKLFDEQDSQKRVLLLRLLTNEVAKIQG